MERKSYGGIDLVKFICAVLIVAIHVAPFGNSKDYAFHNFFVQQFLARISVPYFFIVSGFFLYRKSFRGEFDPAPTRIYLEKFLRLYLLWSILYLPFKLQVLLSVPNSILHSTLSFIRDFVFVGTYGHLWYLHASIVGVVMVSFLLKKRTPVPAILALGAVLYLLGLLAINWISLIRPLASITPGLWKILHLGKKVFVTTRNGIFEGFFFIALGMAFARYPQALKLWAALPGLVISLVLMYIEVRLSTRYGPAAAYDMYLLAAPVSVFLFVCAQAVPLQNQAICRFLRTMSTFLFYIHPMVSLILAQAKHIGGLRITGTPVHFLLTLVISMGLGQGLRMLSQRPGLHWLKMLYS